jgi:hypothetical protein
MLQCRWSEYDNLVVLRVFSCWDVDCIRYRTGSGWRFAACAHLPIVDSFLER